MSRNKNKSTFGEGKEEMEAPFNGDSAESTDNNSANESAEAEKMTEEEYNVRIEETEKPGDATEQLIVQVKEWQEKYIRLSADFDNFRKRTMRERMELIKTASEDTLVSILPIIDDFERALKAMENATEINAVKEGVELIYSKFKDVLLQKGLKPIDAHNLDFDTDFHEAITKIPAPEENLKGKVVDVIQKGYILHDKVVRFAKVVVGE